MGQEKKGLQLQPLDLMDLMARPERFELPTFWFVARHSIQLSYGRVFETEILSNRGGEGGIRTLEGGLSPLLP
jgi:hypothetical protein